MVTNPLDERKNAMNALLRQNLPQGMPQRSAVFAPTHQSAESQSASHELLQKNVEKLVGQTFFGTLMKQMHENPFKSDLFSGGRGEKAFQPLYDSYLTQRMSHKVGDKIVRPIVKKLEKNAKLAYDKQKGGADVSTSRRA